MQVNGRLHLAVVIRDAIGIYKGNKMFLPSNPDTNVEVPGCVRENDLNKLL